MPYTKYTELVTPSRSGGSFSTSWHELTAGGDSTFDGTDCVWFVNGSQYASHYGRSVSGTGDSLAIPDRGAWYPLSAEKLTSVYAQVRGWTGSGYWGPWLTSPTLALLPPFPPGLELSIGSGSAADEVAVKASFPSDTQDREVHDVVFTVTRRANFGIKSATLASRTATSPSDPALAWAGNVSDIEAGLSEDRWVEVTATARARGLAGDSATVTKRHVFAWPGRPQITGISFSGTVLDGGMVMVACKTNQSAYRPTDSVQLERLRSSAAETPAAAQSASGWESVPGAVDDGDCAGLTDPLASAYPQSGTRTWYRVKAAHGSHVLYSAPVALGVFDPVPVPGAVDVFSAASGDDGTSAVVDVGWDDDAALRTQVSWADSPNAWESTAEPQTYEFAWADDGARGGYGNSARVYVAGLEEGTTYYVRARRVGERDGEAAYGAWSSPVAVRPVSAPAWVDLQAPAAIARGESLPLTWTFGSEAAQESWRVIGSDGKVWASGDDANGACSIPPERLSGVDALTLYVALTTGGDWKRSEERGVVIAERPECSASVSPTVTAQPVTVSLGSSVPNASAVVTVTADGVTYVRPDGAKAQYSGDVVYSARLSPPWTEGEGGYVASAELPHMGLVNGGSYRLSVTLADPSTGLSSEASESAFSVSLAHTAPAPTCAVTPDPSGLTAVIEVAEPAGVAEGDVADVYRLTPDGAYPIAEGVAFGSAVTDRLAPFSSRGGTAYRVAVRTADGDVAWGDFAYEMRAGGIRLDWDGKSVSLPYNVGIEEQVAKDFEARTHMDGTTEGFWAAGSARRAALSTDLAKVESQGDMELLRDMARYAGAVFVRAGNGCAFDADVQLSKAQESYGGAVLAVSLDATEVALTAEHMCGPGDIAAPEGGE